MWNFIKKHKLFVSTLFTVVILVSVLGVQFDVVPKNGSPTIGQGQVVLRIGTAEASGTVDYICDGTDDDIQFNGALAALPPNGGELLILAGNYDTNAIVTAVKDNVTIRGVGRGTYITRGGGLPVFTAGGNNWTFSDLRTDAGSIDMLATTGWSWENVTINATYYAYRTDDATTASSWNIPTGRTATYVIAASDAPASVKAQADEVLTGTSMQTQINAAIVTLNATGIKQKLVLIGTFNCTSPITALSHVDVKLIGKIIVNSTNYANHGVVFDGVTDAVWEDAWVLRTGAVIGAPQLMSAGFITGACDNTLVIKNCKFQNSATTVYAGEGLQGLLIGNMAQGDHTTLCSPVVMDTIGISDGASSSYLNCGIDISRGYTSTPVLTRCTGIGGVNRDSDGIIVTESVSAELIDCTGIATSTAGASSGIRADGTSCTFENCKGISSPFDSSFGFKIIGGMPLLISCEGIGSGKATSDYGFLLEGGTAAILQDCYGHPLTAQFQGEYTSANNGRWRPFSTDPWVTIGGMFFYITVANPGITVDIGTSIAGHQIAQNIDIGAAGLKYFNYTKTALAAGAYIYFTPSAGIGDNDFYFFVPMMYNYDNSGGLRIDTSGQARIVGGTFLGCKQGGYGMAVRIQNAALTNLNWKVENCHIETGDTFAIFADSDISGAPFYDCILVGTLSGIKSFAGINSGSPILSGEIRTVSGTLTAGNANAIGFAWHDPELQDIYIKKVVITVTTGGGTVGSHLDVGIADDAVYTNGGTEFFNDLLLNNVQVNDSTNAADGGNQVKWVFCQDSVSATDGWVVGKILDANAASLVGSYYIEYVGK